MLCLDLEYIARADAADYLTPAKAPKGWKDPEKIAAAIAEKEAAQCEDAGLHCDLNRIIVAGWIADDGRLTQHVCHTDEDELEAVRSAWVAVTQELTRPAGQGKIVTFNGWSADWPTLCRRSQLLGVGMPVGVTWDKYRSPLWTGDLAQRLTFGGAIGYPRSLKTYARLFRLPWPDDDIDGSEVAAHWAAGNVEAIRRHNEADLRATRALACLLMK